jgi:hypothetical protein
VHRTGAQELIYAVENGGNSALGGVASAGLISTLGAAQTVTSGAIVVIFFINFGPLIVRKRWKSHSAKMRLRRLAELETGVRAAPSRLRLVLDFGPAHPELGLRRDATLAQMSREDVFLWAVFTARSAWYFLNNSTVVYYCAYMLFAVLGLFATPFAFAWHLLDIMNRYESLKNVLRAVTYNGRQLLMTVRGGGGGGSK